VRFDTSNGQSTQTRARASSAVAVLRRIIIAVLYGAAALAAQSLHITSFSVGPDQPLTYPNAPSNPPYLVDLSDEHTTVIPPASAGAPYLIFGASALSGGNSGAVVLESTDLINFTFAAPLGYNRQVMAAPVPFTQCNPSYETEFDGNYAAPGSVVQDPTLPPGNLIMIYEAENHCPGGVHNSDYYATVGFARSSDNGKTWPAPINGPSGGTARHPVLQNSIPQPTTAHGPLGDAIPSAFVDQNANGDHYLSIVYEDHMDDGKPSKLRIARAKLGADPLTFLKWNNGSFSEPGIGGVDTPFLPPGGCSGAQNMGEITRNDDLGLYVALFVCTGSNTGTWYYSTATSLDLEDWSVPQPIANSQFPSTPACSADGRGQQFDGWYPSAMSPQAPAGHTKLTGFIFLMNGCDTGTRKFASRTFTITAGSGPAISLVANAEGESPTIAPNTWLEIKGFNLAPVGDSRIWADSDFSGGKMPAQLDGVSATVNGKAAYVYYVSPGQVNILSPPDAMSGPVQVVVNNNGASASFTAQAAVLSPSFFVFSDRQHVAAVHLDGTLVGPASFSVPGYTFSPAKPGETISVYANGFGPTSTPVVSGSILQSGTLSPQPAIKIGGMTAKVQFAGLVSPGLFQFNVVIPPGLPDGDQSITATFSGTSTQAGTLIAIEH